MLVCFLLPLKREIKMSDTCRLFPPFGDPWPSCLLPSQEDDSVGLSGSLGWTCLLTCLSPPLPGHWPPNHVTHTPVRLYIYEFITKVMQRSVASIDHIYYKAYTKMATVKGWCACVLSHIQLFCDPSMDCSPPGSSVHGILHARILEWVAISFSNA